MATEQLRAHASELSKKYEHDIEIVEAGAETYCIIKGVKLMPGKFNLADTMVLFKADQMYPSSAMDMFWVEETLRMADGTIPPSADEVSNMVGIAWRRFSRHRGPQSPQWDPNGNGIEQQYLLASIDLVVKP